MDLFFVFEDPSSSTNTPQTETEDSSKKIMKNTNFSSEKNLPFVFENPSKSSNSPQTDLEGSLKKMTEETFYQTTLPPDVLLAPHKRKRRSGKPPRAQNKFILFRKDYIARVRKEDPVRTKSMNTRDFSKEAKQQWEVQPVEVKRLFTIMADVAAKRHKAMYPGYVYEPEKKEKHVPEEFSEFIDYSHCS
ncbi:40927_t:CDS:1 [Gigaspora margarita]|uniref:40927_t:CDS:1 n=1 Tax=Gigaspora margarita TaxID=4874 RepID=A0ABN7VHW5_GIGMA|nr:40927_t:CDS:1 [Gigaspora margarita]